ncbi:hypothetical protein JW887_00975 [Candidatus Dojkabacteria bacterium]|nr:hypothetical protein [Candidatus Dojkabacteria bacterium]
MESTIIQNFLDDYPRMSISPSPNADTVFKGQFDFRAKPVGGEEILDCYKLKIVVPDIFPDALPKVMELDNKIPTDNIFHVNWDGTLCLGSPIRLMMKISAMPTLSGYAQTCIMPYLYAVSYKLQHGGRFIFDELAHGEEGVVDDYIQLFGVKSPEQVMNVLKMLSTNDEDYHHLQCPCGCGNTLNDCSYRLKIDSLRKIAPIEWFEKHLRNIGAGM